MDPSPKPLPQSPQHLVETVAVSFDPAWRIRLQVLRGQDVLSETYLGWDAALDLALLLQRMAVAKAMLTKVTEEQVKRKTSEFAKRADLFVARSYKAIQDRIQADQDAIAVRRGQRKSGLAVFTRVKV